MRKTIMYKWWDFWPNKPLWLQLAVGRLLCWKWGHEWDRYIFCDWCGKEKETDKS